MVLSRNFNTWTGTNKSKITKDVNGENVDNL